MFPILVNCVWFLRQLRKCMNVVIVSIQISKTEREICEFNMDWKNFLFAL